MARIEKEGNTPPIPMNRQKHEDFLLALFQNFKDLEKVRHACCCCCLLLIRVHDHGNKSEAHPRPKPTTPPN